MSDKINSSQKLVEVIKKNMYPSYINTAKTEISIRCPYCGDSIKSDKSAHLYIEIEEPHRFYCQRCNTKGYVTPEFLKDIKLHDQDLKNAIYKVNKEIKYNIKKKSSLESFSEKRLKIPEWDIGKNEKEKIKYLEDRLGFSIDNEMLKKYRIIPNFKQFFSFNDLHEKRKFTQRDLDMVNILNEDCIGFLNYDHSFIIFRSLDDEYTGFRYHNYNIFNSYENTKRFYTVESEIDALKPELNIIISEGIIDMISIHHNFYDGKEKDNSVFTAVNGMGYSLVLKYFARLGFLSQNIEIYSDSTVSIKFFKRMKKYNDFLLYSNIKVFYNKKYDDFGTKIDNIELKYNTI